MHHNGRLGVLVEVNSETDFVARNENFKKFAKDLALHIANTAPHYVKREDVPQSAIDKERSIQREKTLAEGKKEAIVDKIVDGRMDKWYEEIVLLEQPWLHDDKLKVGDVLTQLELPSQQIIAQAQSDANKLKLREQTETAKAKGIFGAPTFFAGDEMFWGNDRLDDALSCCRSLGA